MVPEEVHSSETETGQDMLELGGEGKKAGSGVMVGAALGFGIGMVFALGGFWAGIITIIFALAGAVVGKIFFEG